MSERLPYEEQLTQQWNDLPLPDENMAWEDMRHRLEEDDDKPIIPIWLRGCALWGSLSVLLIALGWWLFTLYTNKNKKEEIEKVQASTQQQINSGTNKDNTNAPVDSAHMSNNQSGDRTKNTQPANEGNTASSPNLSSSGQTTDSINKTESNRRRGKSDGSNSITVTNVPVKKTKDNTVPGTKQSQPSGLVTKKKTGRTNPPKKQVKDQDDITINATGGSVSTNSETEPVTVKNKPEVTNIDSSKQSIIPLKNTDSSSLAKKDSVKKKNPEETVKKNESKKDSAKQKSISFSAGIALHQLLPVDGQKLTPYNAQGRKGSLADYIPSVYFRMYKDGKWFLQSEFRYGAPQYNREITYFSKGVPDTQGSSTIITSNKLKKTFYHQLPVSFNYFVLPNLSLGGGFVWNKFSSAVSEVSVVKRMNTTGGDTVINPGTIFKNPTADTNFARSYFQALIEAQYKWKRFSLGARYSFGLQPYLTFTLPGGTQQREKNTSLQVFLRYELWRSKKIIKK